MATIAAIAAIAFLIVMLSFYNGDSAYVGHAWSCNRCRESIAGSVILGKGSSQRNTATGQILSGCHIGLKSGCKSNLVWFNRLLLSATATESSKTAESAAWNSLDGCDGVGLITYIDYLANLECL